MKEFHQFFQILCIWNIFAIRAFVLLTWMVVMGALYGHKVAQIIGLYSQELFEAQNLFEGDHFEGGDFNVIEPGCVLIGWEGEEGRSHLRAAQQLKQWFEKEEWEVFITDIDPYYVHIDLMVVMLAEKLAAKPINIRYSAESLTKQ